ncbi:MAG: precorrin-2 C(20)-methyltransferase [Nitrospiraceae bacterium]
MTPPLGTLYGIGVGPGDPDLITLKAVRLLRRVPVVLIPQSVNRSSVALSIVRRWLRPGRQRLLLQPYPMMAPEEALVQAREEAARVAVSFLISGTDLAWVTEGDPLLYSTFIDLLARTKERLMELKVEVIPAVSSITACAAITAMPLAGGSERMAVVPATDSLDDLEEVLEQFDTVILLKVRNVIERLVERLDRIGFTGAAVLVEECGRPTQRVTRELRSCLGNPLSYFSMVMLCRKRVVDGISSESL